MKTLFIALAKFGLAGAAQAADFDVVILNGLVMEPESNFDAVRNIGVKDGKICKNKL